MFRIEDEEANLVVSENRSKQKAITDAGNKYRNLPKASKPFPVTLTIRKQDKYGAWVKVGTFTV